MEIGANSSSGMSQFQFQAELSTRVARKALDNLETEGEQLVQILESIPTPSASPTTTSGSNIDTMA